MKVYTEEMTRLMTEFCSTEGPNPTPLAHVYCLKISNETAPRKELWRSSLAIVAQGCKEVGLEPELLRGEATFYTISPLDIPVVSRVVNATREKPFYALIIRLDPLLLSEVATQCERQSNPLEPEESSRALFSGVANEPMLEAAVRLLKLLRRGEDVAALGPLILRELLYHVLKGNEGSAIRQFLRSGSKMHRISKAIHKLRSDLTEEIDVVRLMKDAHMSRSSFFKHFKEATAMSPVQYQKRLRLLEARRLMVEEAENAESAAFRVGYKSASQFSREYARMFGRPPLKDAHTLKTTQTALRSM